MKANGAALVMRRSTICISHEHLATFNPTEDIQTWTPITHSKLVEALHEELVRQRPEDRRQVLSRRH